MSTSPLRRPMKFRNGFGEKRPAQSSNPERHHAGIDIRAKAGELVYAPESGTVAAVQGWTSTNKAVVLQTDDGRTIILAAVRPLVNKGQRVREGERVATIKAYPGGSTMLHFELYSRHVASNKRWAWGLPAPSWLVNPYDYLATLSTSPTSSSSGGGRRRSSPSTTTAVLLLGGYGLWRLLR